MLPWRVFVAGLEAAERLGPPKASCKHLSRRAGSEGGRMNKVGNRTKARIRGLAVAWSTWLACDGAGHESRPCVIVVKEAFLRLTRSQREGNPAIKEKPATKFERARGSCRIERSPRPCGFALLSLDPLVSTRNTQSSRNARKLLKTNDRVWFYPTHPVSEKSPISRLQFRIS